MTAAVEPVEPRLRELVGGVAVLRLLVVAWALAVSLVDARSGVLARPSAALALATVMLAWSGAVGMWTLTAVDRAVRRSTLAVDVLVAAAIVAADWFVYDGPHPQSFGSAWPATSVLLVGVVGGRRAGLVAGGGLGAVNVLAAAAVDRLDGRGLALGGTLVLLAATGGIAGWVSTRLRRAESEVAAARERERFARTLHDGVLQTLAVVQRRSDDESLVGLAREQEWELRRFIGGTTAPRTGTVDELRAVAARVERLHHVRVEVVVVADPDLGDDRLDAVVGAVGEALTNAAKHADATRITVCVDVEDDGSGARVTVVDDGRGFDPSTAPTDRGLARSITARVTEIGGRVEVRSAPGRGSEVAVWVP